MSGVYKTEAWLKKYGWTKGKGLGKNENGIKDFIKVDKKDDTVGLGGEGYAIRDFNWWDNIYNKAAQKLKIEATEDGKSIVHVEQPKVEVPETKKYGVFVKSKVPDNFSSNIREEELIKVCEGRQLKAKQDGKLARLEEQERQAISANTLRITKPRGREDASEDSSSASVHKEAKKSSYGKNYRPLVLTDKLVKTGDKVQQDNENKTQERPADDSHERSNNEVAAKKSKKNKKRKRSDSAEQIQPERKKDKKESSSKKDKKYNKLAANTSTNKGFFFFNYDDENKKIEQSPSSGPRASSIEEVRSDSTARLSKSAKRRANKKQRTS